MSNTIAIFNGLPPNFSVCITADAQAAKNTMLANSRWKVGDQITTPEELSVAQGIAANIKALSRDAEALRVQLKRPVIDAGNEIDTKVKQYTLELIQESKRIEAVMGRYVAQEREKQRKAQEDRDRQQREAEEAVRLEQAKLAEIERKRAAAEQAAASARNAKDREAAEKEARLLREQAQELEIDISESQPVAAPTPAAPIAVAGASVRPEYEIEVVSPSELYKAHPQCVKLEPKLQDIKDLIRRGIIDIPGVKLTPKTSVSVRASGVARLTP